MSPSRQGGPPLTSASPAPSSVGGSDGLSALASHCQSHHLLGSFPRVHTCPGKRLIKAPHPLPPRSSPKSQHGTTDRENSVSSGHRSEALKQAFLKEGQNHHPDKEAASFPLRKYIRAFCPSSCSVTNKC